MMYLHTQVTFVYVCIYACIDRCICIRARAKALVRRYQGAVKALLRRC